MKSMSNSQSKPNLIKHHK